jgi:hypothetical protein
VWGHDVQYLREINTTRAEQASSLLIIEISNWSTSPNFAIGCHRTFQCPELFLAKEKITILGTLGRINSQLSDQYFFQFLRHILR